MTDDLAYAMVFGRVVSSLRERRNLSQSELAGLAGITQGTLSRIESGQLRCDILLARRIAIALELEYDAFTATVEEAWTRTREFAARVTEKKPSKKWLDDLVVLAGAVGILALVTLAVESLLEGNRPRRPSGKAK